VLAIIDEVGKSPVEPWQDKAVTTALMAKPPAPGKITAEKQLGSLGVTEWTLSNGARVVVKPTDFEADAVSIEGDSPGGLAMASDKQYNDARFADTVAQIGGAGDFDLETLDKMLAGKHVQVATAIGETTESIEATGSSRDLETMLQLVYLHVTAPRSDAQVFKVWQANAREQLANALRTPEVQFARQSQSVLFKNHLRRAPLEATDLDRIDPDKALAFFKDRFGDVSDFTFVIVGVVDLAKLRPLVETYLASLPAKGRKEKEVDQHVRRTPGIVKKQWKIGQDPKAQVAMAFHADETWSRDKDRDMFILGQVLSIRLREILREDMGGVYNVGAGGSIARSPHQERQFQIQFGCAPENVDKLIAATFAEIAAIQKAGIGADYLEKIKSSFLRERETELRQNNFWSGWLESSYRYGDDPSLILDPSKMVGRMTSDNVKAAAKRYLDAKQYYQAVLLPAS
jgi:zinc protease